MNMTKTQARDKVLEGNEVAIGDKKLVLNARKWLSDYDRKRVQYTAEMLLQEHPYAVVDVNPSCSGIGMNLTHHYGAMFFKDFKAAWDYANA